MRAATDPVVVTATNGLVGYLRELVRAGTARIRDLDAYAMTVWLGDLPEGVRVPSQPGDLVLALDYEPAPVRPALPAALSGHIEPAEPDDPIKEPVLSAPPGGEDSEDSEGAGEPDLPRTLRDWLPAWRSWAAHEKASRPRRELYKKLAQQARVLSLQDDEFEAVLAVGLLTWASSGTPPIVRHLVTRRLDLRLDRRTAQLTASLAAEAATRLEDHEFLDSDDGYSAERTISIREQLATSAPHPLSEEAENITLEWRAVGLETAVQYDLESGPGREPAAQPQLSVSPALIVRRRNRNALVEFYDKIASSLTSLRSPGAPLGLAQLLFPLDEAERMSWAANTSYGDGPLGSDPLFPLATNQAQRDVLTRLSEDTAVVVQGPPGTGKTHTIANLMSALLAQGQRVLVTSQKDQALRVLRDKLPATVKDLCVLLASSPGAGTTELERSITALSDRAATSDASQLERVIADLEQRRETLRSRRAQLINEMARVRQAEFIEHPEVSPGYSGTLAAIASSVATDRQQYSWLPSTPYATPEPPLTAVEAVRLWELLRSSTPDRRARRAQIIPPPEDLPSAADVRIAIDHSARARSTQMPTHPLVHSLVQLHPRSLDAARRLLDDASQAIHQLQLPRDAGEWDVTTWPARAVLDGFVGRSRLWDYVIAQANQAIAIHRALAATAMRSVVLPSASPEELAVMEHDIAKLRQHMAGGGQIRPRFRSREQKAAQPVLDRSRIDGRPPESADDLAVLNIRLGVASATGRLAASWAQLGMIAPPGTPETQLPLLAHWADSLGHVQHLWRIRAELDSLLIEDRMQVPLSTPDQWDTFAYAMRAAGEILARRRAEQALDDIGRTLAEQYESADAPPELRFAYNAVRIRDIDGYIAALQSLQGATAEKDEQAECDKLLTRLRTAHPSLVTQLVGTVADPSWQNRLATLPTAWAWRVADQFCDHFRQPDLDQQLQHDLDDTEGRLTAIVGELAAAQAFRHCLLRMTQEQRSALQAYKSAMTAVGKGTGIHANRHRRQARDAMTVARDAVPAWVMTIPDVAETIPPQPNSFDVVIVDEASQIGIEGAFLLWLAPRIIVVGDDKQCAPGSIKYGELRKVYDRLDYYLPDTPDWMKQGFDPRSNLYELLSARFPRVIRLTEHFRCMPEIISWSSRQFYDDRLVPLRQFGADRLPPVKVVTVGSGYTEGRDARIRNEPEAKLIVESLVTLHKDPAYAGKSFGVVVLQGDGQARLIETLINETLEPEDIEARNLRVGTPPQFQGDERDIILLSMVVAEPGRALTQLAEQRRFNVAASRAKDQLWLFTSVGLERLSSKDLRHSLLSYMLSPPAVQGLLTDIGTVRPDQLRQPFDSVFEQRVYLHLVDRGYAVAPHVLAQGKYIDLVVLGTNGRLAIECDGDTYHTTPEQIYADLDRERELRRVGWEFWRVRASEFAFDPERALRPLWPELDLRGIAPGVVVSAPRDGAGNPWEPAELPDDDDEPELETA